LSRLLLVRHGETKLNNAKRFQGHTDAELSAAGIRQAERLRNRLVNEKIGVVYSSDLRRALLTTEIISSGHKTNIVACSELREINYGKLEGLTFEEISRLHPEIAELIANFSLQLKFPGGESVEELSHRVIKFMDRLKKHAAEETILIVAHSAPLRLLMCHLLGIELHYWRQLRLDLASLSILDTYPQVAILSLLNDVSHLKGD